MLTIFKNRIYIAVLLILSTLGLGVFGFRFFAEYSWTDAVYMTMITISTVGFGEVQPLNDTAKIFTVILILVSVIVLGYAISIITEYILSRSNFELIKQRSVQKRIEKLENHVIIVGKYLKSKNPDIKIWGIDTYGSVFKKYHETGVFDESEIYPYITEGIGEDILPENVDFKIIDGFTKVTDKDAAVYTQRLAKEEGFFLGNSAGAAIKGLLQLKEHFKEGDVVVILFHDHGSRYVGKMYNDNWMREKGFID